MSSFPPPPPPPSDPNDETVRRPAPLQPPTAPPTGPPPVLPPVAPPSFEPVPAYLQPTLISPPPVAGNASYESDQPTGDQEPPSGRKNGWIVAGIIGGAAAIGGAVGLLLSGGGDEPATTASTVITVEATTPITDPVVVVSTTVPPATTAAPTTVVDTTVPPETTPPETIPDLTAIPANDSGAFTGPGRAMIVAAQLPSGPTALDVTPATLTLQAVADLLAAGDFAGVQALLPQEVVDPAAFAFAYGSIERLSMIVLDARAGADGFEMLAAGVSNEGAQTSIRCFRWFSNGSAVDRVGDPGSVVAGPFPEQFTAEEVRNNPDFMFEIALKCTWQP